MTLNELMAMYNAQQSQLETALKEFEVASIRLKNLANSLEVLRQAIFKEAKHDRL